MPYLSRAKNYSPVYHLAPVFLATHDGERAGWKSIVNLRRTGQPGIPVASMVLSSQLSMMAQPAQNERRHR